MTPLDRLTRRALFLSTAAVAALAVTGCSLLGNATTAQIKSDIDLIANGLSALVTALPGLVPQNILDKATAIIADIESAAALIATAATPSASVLQQVSAAISALVALLTPFFPMAGPIGAAVQAAWVLINVVLQLAGVNATPVPAPGPVPAAFRETWLSAAQARAILAAAAANGLR